MTTRAISSKALARDSSCIPMGCRSEAAGVAVNSKGHIYLFQRTKPMLTEYDDKGNFVQSIGEGLFVHPHGLPIGSRWGGSELQRAHLPVPTDEANADRV